MGCVSSRIVTKSLSFREEVNRSLKRRESSLEEIIVSKNGGDQIVALLRTANTVAARLKEGSPAQEASKNSPQESIDSTVIVNEVPQRNTSIETINTWELLAGLEEDKETEEQSDGGPGIEVTSHKTEDHKFIISNDVFGPSRSFRTVEDFDALVAANASLEGSEASIKECIKQEGNEEGLMQESIKQNAPLERHLSKEKGSRRKTMAKELAALKVPGFEFSRSGSLREWLSLGGQMFSPGSYVTPKFGNFASPAASDGDNTIVFDPELVAQFEEAMKQLTVEEECVLREIIESLERDHEEGTSRLENERLVEI